MNRLLKIIAVSSFLIPASALAQEVQVQQPVQPAPGASTATGVIGGAAVGAAVGGPIGAAVGAVVGGTIGAAEVRTYVMQEQAPSARVTTQIVEGQPLAAEIEVRPVPKHPQYAFAIVNNKRVIVEAKTRQVVKVYE
jgi:hypothetical protein